MKKDATFWRALLCLVFGALSFLMLLPGALSWAGLLLAVLAITLGWQITRRPEKTQSVFLPRPQKKDGRDENSGAGVKPGRIVQIMSVAGIALAVIAALINLLTSWGR